MSDPTHGVGGDRSPVVVGRAGRVDRSVAGGAHVGATDRHARPLGAPRCRRRRGVGVVPREQRRTVRHRGRPPPRRRPLHVPEPPGAVQARLGAAAVVDRRPRPATRWRPPTSRRGSSAVGSPTGTSDAPQRPVPRPPTTPRIRPAARSSWRPRRRSRRAAAPDRPAGRTRRAGRADVRGARRARPLARRPHAHRPRRPGTGPLRHVGRPGGPARRRPRRRAGQPGPPAGRRRRRAGPTGTSVVLAEIGVLHLLSQAGPAGPRAARTRSPIASRPRVRLAGPPGRRARRRSRHRPLARRRAQRHPRGPHRGPPHVAAGPSTRAGGRWSCRSPPTASRSTTR